MNYAGKLILIVAPSGSGKSVLCAHLRETFPELLVPISSTTRMPRPNERDGAAYHFLARDEFERRAAAGEFLEWAEYGGNLYGTPKQTVLEALENGQVMLREVEVKGARALRKLIPSEHLAVIFIDGGGWEALERRILKRAPISPDELKRRKDRYEDEERVFGAEADYVVRNYDGTLEEAKAAAEAALREILGTRSSAGAA